MKFIETNKHRLIEKDTMELAMAWYYRYIEKEEQVNKIEKNLIEFEEQLNKLTHKDNTISVALLQELWRKNVHI